MNAGFRLLEKQRLFSIRKEDRESMASAVAVPSSPSSSAHQEDHGELCDDQEKLRQAALLAVGARPIQDPAVSGLLVSGWRIQSKKCSILNMHAIEQWERMLGTTHLPDMVFGDSSLELIHEASGLRIHFNAFDALRRWKEVPLPPVQVPAAAKWKFRSKPSQQLILDYDYTFTTPYCGSESIEPNGSLIAGGGNLEWVVCEDHIDLTGLQARDPILFYDEVVLYEDELADNGVSLLTVKVRVMPSCWFLLLRYWLRVDGVLMRLRDTRMYSSFQSDCSEFPLVIRECCIREETFQALVARGLPSEPSLYGDASMVAEKLQIHHQQHDKLVINSVT
eukprot:c22871_g1_i1 orf=529-1536(-)